ncbi:MAG: hypothetical protein NZ455_00535 [Bacteroidia bacterium]|nr:hypothetical protein [Bacteroidia bacterium]MDW8347569.1 hypothetical protein [Bacteroidia bacterium]
MRRVRQQCAAQRSTEAKAQPVARRPKAQRRDTPQKFTSLIKNLSKLAWQLNSRSFILFLCAYVFYITNIQHILS